MVPACSSRVNPAVPMRSIILKITHANQQELSRYRPSPTIRVAEIGAVRTLNLMRLAVRQGFAIAQLTALEAVRLPITVLLTAAALTFIACMPFVFTHTLHEGERLVRDSALALHFVLGLILGVLIACAAVRAELRGGTASAILSKPVARPVFFIGKYVGVAFVMMAFSLLMGCAVLLATRTASLQFSYDLWGSGPLLVAILLALAAGGVQNFFLRVPFASRAFGALLLFVPAAVVVGGFAGSHAGDASESFHLPLEIVPASALISLAILLLTGIATSLATRLDIVPSLAVCSSIFMLGLMSDYLFARRASNFPLFGLADAVLPNFQHFWAADALAGDGIPWAYVGKAALYTLAYLTAVISSGIAAFRGMELRG